MRSLQTILCIVEVADHNQEIVLFLLSACLINLWTQERLVPKHLARYIDD